jgi:hypothetical protein
MKAAEARATTVPVPGEASAAKRIFPRRARSSSATSRFVRWTTETMFWLMKPISSRSSLPRKGPAMLHPPRGDGHRGFTELSPADWFRKDDDLDAPIRRRFVGRPGAVERGELFPQRRTPRGRLAEILLLD